ncbi:BRO-N domain-containing protein [Methanobrevibacter curvatus]|uniref:Bro-N domain-containing protein n=1 Tax=Methanobrevibacter curvatus TaxID=49547 RepID=A0A166DHT6_9EURY|nr:Bro-N domain-containing protein [Methanobrevibacter curvatus]KZX15616.1 hypothetical protein MBCUR_02500 [Methanobrevibacter curvatus]
MANKNQIKLFQNYKIRSVWKDEDEEWYFSVIDVVGVLSESKNPNNYWKVLKHRLKKEGSEMVTNCNQLKLKSTDGKFYKTDVANAEQLFRIIQTIPSPKAEPFKLWLAKVGQERLDEIADPQLAIERAISNYRKKGYSEDWITQRLKTIESRKDLTGEWNRAGVKEGIEYAILTNEVTKAWSGMTTKEYKKYKELKKENLRDNMSNAELVLNMGCKYPPLKYLNLKILKDLVRAKILLKEEEILQELLVKI